MKQYGCPTQTQKSVNVHVNVFYITEKLEIRKKQQST